MPHTRATSDALLAAGSLLSAASMGFPWPDWATIVGPTSGLVISVVMLGIFIKHSRDRIRREDARYKEELQERANHAAAILAIQLATNKTLQNLTNVLSRRPCLCNDHIEIEDTNPNQPKP